jgi:bifunctional non-homologous end joining protein LigD
VNVRFIPPMENLPVKKLPTGAMWTYEIKLDGFRMEAVRTDDRVILYSRRGNEMAFPEIATALKNLPPETIIDGELTALDERGRPEFNLLQNFRSGSAHLVYFVFDILVHSGRNVMRLPLSERRSLLQKVILHRDCIQIAESTTDLTGLEHFVKEQKLEGIVGKQIDRLYEPGRRSGSWVKLRLNKRQEFVIGGYTPSHLGLDALLVGFYHGKDLRFAGSVRAGLIPQTRREVHDKIKGLETDACPFVNLPDRRAGRWGQGITVEKMRECRWLKPITVAEIEFTEWTPDDRLRSASFICLREDKHPRRVIKETV